MSHRAAGIDWATQDKGRAIVILQSGDSAAGAAVESITESASTDAVAEVCTFEELDVVAVDTPFGWPVEFSRFVASWNPRALRGGEVPACDRFAYRLTDRIVCEELRKNPLSVSSDRIGLSARAWVELVHQNGWHHRLDLGCEPPSEKPPIIEVYPGATLRALLPDSWVTGPEDLRDYKKSPGKRAAVLEQLVRGFRISCDAEQERRLVGEGSRSDPLDALVAALTGRIYLGLQPGWTVRRPLEEDRESAGREGWIFFPVREAALAADR